MERFGLLVAFFIQLTPTAYLIKDFHVNFSVSENSRIGTPIGSLASELSHKFYNVKKLFRSTQLKYRFSKTNNYFELNEKSGTIKTKANIDLEDLCDRSEAVCKTAIPQMSCTINVWDDTAFVAIIKAMIFFDDENDNFPTFPTKFTLKRINEINLLKDRKIYLPQAIDNDVSERNRKINYELSQTEHEYFRLNIESKTDKPFIVLLKNLDAETEENHTIVLFAWNEGFRENQSHIVIKFEILDFNDNEPYFNLSKYVIAIPENTTISSNIYKITAFDPDKTAKLIYRLDNSVKSSIKRTFLIQEDGIIVLIKSLDYETDQVHSFLVEVFDGVHAASATIHVKVIDINDEFPSIQIYPSKLSINENIISGVSVGQIKITDRDSREVNGNIYCHEPEGMNNEQPFTFHPDPSIMQDANNFEIKSRMTFNREEYINGERVPSIRAVLLTCSDGHGTNVQKLTTTFTISVTIEDVNDNVPLFSDSTYNLVLMENNNIDAHIHKFVATDKDEGLNAQITFTIADSNDFKIDSVSGWLIAMKMFDREERDHYTVIVQAQDHGSPAFTTSVTVNITIGDRNDNPPQLISFTEFSLEENLKPFSGPVGVLKAKDDDIGLNGKIVFQHMWPNDGFFEITPNGTIYAKMSFDREKEDRYFVRVKISDLGTENAQHTIVAISIRILDVNDNSPHFVEPVNLLSRDNIAGPTNAPAIPFDLSIYEIPGELIVKVKAVDPDFEKNGKITYSLKIPLGLPKLFEIDRDEGEVKVSQTLTRNDIGFYRVQVIASDNGSPPLSDIKVLLINVVDKPPGIGKDKNKENNSLRTWALFGTTNNILIVVVLSGISAILVVVLITAISCMLNPCHSRNSQIFSRGQRYQSSFDNQSKNFDHINDLELLTNVDKQYGSFYPNLSDDFENRTLIIPSNIYEQPMCRMYSSPTLREGNFHVWSTADNITGLNSNQEMEQDPVSGTFPQMNVNNMQSFSFNRMTNRSAPFCIHNRCISSYKNNNDIFLSTISDEHQSDSGRGGSDDDVATSLTRNSRLKPVNGIQKISQLHPRTIHSSIKQTDIAIDSLTTVGEEREATTCLEDALNRSRFQENEKEDLTLLCDKINDLFFNNGP